ncbi:MAG: RNA polymerase sigma factor [Planctomycetota bacterium]
MDATAFQQALRNCIQQLSHQPQSALAELFDLTAQRLVRYASTIAGNQSDAEDALQSVFSLLARDPRYITAALSPWPYLIRSIRNETLRILRKNARRGPLRADATPQNGSNPAEECLTDEVAQHVRRLLQSLPPEQAEVILLKHWEELTFAEIADSLNLSQNTVASRYRYALEKLQRSLEPLIR